jgi:hypothetical protein
MGPLKNAENQENMVPTMALNRCANRDELEHLYSEIRRLQRSIAGKSDEIIALRSRLRTARDVAAVREAYREVAAPQETALQNALQNNGVLIFFFFSSSSLLLLTLSNRCSPS